MTQARFLTLEGVDGVGKSTQALLLVRRLLSHGIEVIHTREPGGTPIGEALRGVMLDPRYPEFDALTELLTMFAARNQHLQELIRPALADGKWVVCDRFTTSTYLYQIIRANRPDLYPLFKTLLEAVVGVTTPNLEVTLSLPVNVAQRRLQERLKVDRLDNHQQEQLAAMHDALHSYKASHRVIVDGEGSTDVVHERIWSLVEQRLLT